MKCQCLHCQWTRTDRSENFYKWAGGHEYQLPIGLANVQP